MPGFSRWRVSLIDQTMRVVITGGTGQLGRALARQLASGHEVFALGRRELDVTHPDAGVKVVRLNPDVVIHCAAWTDVDGCARDPERAYLVNALGTRNVVLGCQQAGCPLVYISTNEVFDGRSTRPYYEYDPPNPINPYGRSKLAGEQVVQTMLDRFYIVRTAWLFGCDRENFVTKIFRRADTVRRLEVVTDEVGSPTYVEDLAAAIARLIETGVYGIYHFVNSGQASRYELAVKALELCGRRNISIRGIRLAEYRRASTPPPYSVLANLAGRTIGIEFRPWEEALAEYLRQVWPE